MLELAATNGDLPAQRAAVRRLLDGVVAAEAITDHPGGVALAVPNAGAEIPVCSGSWMATVSRLPGSR